MRVAILTPNARAGDAIGRGIVEKVGYFVDRGADVSVVIAETAGLHPALRPFSIRQLPDDVRGDGYRALARADLIVAEYSQYHAIFELLPLLADGSRRIIVDYHGVTPANLASSNQRDALIRGREWTALAGLADAAIVHSRHSANELSETVRLPAERVHRVGLPIDDQWFTPGLASSTLQKQLGLGPARILLFVGRLAKNKRLPDLISALPFLADLDPPFHVVAVGPSGDCYEAERQYCRELAADLGVTDRVHFLGNVDESTLRDCYRSAAALVIPSIHEGFCMPVIEAMACGLPVIAARASALPETVGEAGMCFNVNDSADLAAQIRRVFSMPKKPATGRIAVVTPEFGETVGGAERSLTLIANQLRNAGQTVEVFTIDCADCDLAVRAFNADHSDDERRAAALERCATGDESSEPTYWRHTLRSEKLVQALNDAGPWDAIIVGPFANGLTRDIVRRFGSQVVLVPCLHDEPAARLPGVRAMFSTAGGVLFHSAEERELANAQFGFNHPNSAIIGTYVKSPQVTDTARGRKLARYVVSIGRRVAEKGLPQLFDWARRYHVKHPDRFRCAFVGEGPLPIPNEPWAVDLGRLSDEQKTDLLTGALALVNLSQNESLSLVVLEAQAHGVPVIVSAESPVLSGHVDRGQGGWCVANYDEFARALDQLWNEPESSIEYGHAGRKYVEEHYGDPEVVVRTVRQVIINLARPLPDVMREAGLQRASQFSRSAWRSDFELIIEQVFDQPTGYQPSRFDLVAIPSPNESECRVVLRHLDGAPLVPTGPGRSEILLQVRDAAGEPIGKPQVIVLRKIITAGQQASFRVPVSATLGEVTLEPGLRRYKAEGSAETTWFGPHVWSETGFDEPTVPFDLPGSPRLAKLIDQAQQIAQLPDDYVDVTAGRFARMKQWLKAKLLHNFRVSYVDAISRQQTRFNQQVLEAIAAIAADRDEVVKADPRHDRSEQKHKVPLREAS